VAALILVVDQVSKSLVRVLWSASSVIPWDGWVAALIEPQFGPYDSLPLIGQIVFLSHVRNTGAAFGLLPGYQPVFMLTSIVVLVVVAAYWRRARPSGWPVVIGLALVSAGAVGNLIDRAVLGRVTDFVDVAVIDFPVFNVADSAILVGVTILVAWLLFGPQPEAETHTDATAERPEPGEETSRSEPV
jgi:signal peptidase II